MLVVLFNFFDKKCFKDCALRAILLVAKLKFRQAINSRAYIVRTKSEILKAN
jgi:hypothetical protein